eukprot:scaffold2577_cov123-Cylindrotheca_fusiformis.AAC.2
MVLDPNPKLQIFANSRTYLGPDAIDYARKHGLCTICGVFRTHERKKTRIFRKAAMTPITVTNNKGVTTVYKGHCISATCYQSVDQVRIKLGEIPGRRQSKNSKPASHPSSAVNLLHSPPPSNKRPVHISPQPQFSSRQGSKPSSLAAPTTNQTTTDTHEEMPRSARRFRPEAAVQEPPMPPFIPAEQKNSMQTTAVEKLQSSNSDLNQSHSTIGSNSSWANNSSNDVKESANVAALNGGGIPQLSLSADRASMHPIIAEFREALAAGDYVRFLNALDQKGRNADLVVEGLGLFRMKIAKDQRKRPNGVVLGGSNWMKAMTTPFDTYCKEKEVIVSGLLTMLTLSNLPGNYKGPITKKGGVDVLLKLLDVYSTDAEIIELVCAAFASLTINEKGGLNGKSEKVTKVVRQLAELLCSSDQVGREYSLLPLCNLSNQRKRLVETGRSPWYDVRDCLATAQGTGAIAEVLEFKDIHPAAAEAGLSLLWKLSVPKDEQDKGGSFTLTPEIIKSIVACMKRFNSYGVVLAGSRALANLALRTDFPAEWAGASVESIEHFMIENSSQIDEEMAICFLHAFCNLFANDSTRTPILSNSECLQSSLILFDKFPSSEALVEFGCLAIAHAGVESKETKQLVVNLGGLDLVREAFHEHIVTTDADHSPEVKDAIFCAVASLSGCETGAKHIMESQLLNKLHGALAVEQDDDFRSVLGVAIRNTTNGVATSTQAELRQQPGLFSYLIQNADSEASVVALLEDLNSLGEASFEAYGNGGFDALLSSMGKYRDSAGVQVQGCQALAQVFYYLPFTNLDAPTQLPTGGWAVLYGLPAIETMQYAIRMHRKHTEVQHEGFCALSNFLAPICTLDSYSEEKMVVGQWLEAGLNDILDVMNENAGDVTIQKRGMNVLWSCFCLCSSEILQRWKLGALQRIFDTMTLMKGDDEIFISACDALMGEREDSESLNFMGESIIVHLVESLVSDNVEVASRAVAVLSILLKNVFVASSHAMQVPNFIVTLLSCMSKNQTNCDIQIYVCSALESLMNFEDDSLRAEISRGGGLDAISNSIRLHGTNPKLVDFACRVLSLFVSSVNDAKMVASLRNSLGDTLTAALEAHVDSAGTESAVMDALWSCCSHDDYFKRLLITNGSLGMIVQVMTLHLGSAEVQRSGCSLLWILSSYGSGKDTIGQFGGVAAVINALLAHNESTTVQKEGLTALKNLATASQNKNMIEEAGGEDAVLYALWIHYKHPQVISSAFSALNNIAVDSATKSVKLMNEKTIEICVFAMSRFPMDETVQKNVCFYLKSLSYSPANLEMICQYRDQVIPLLHAASDTFPQSCRDRARSVIGKMKKFGSRKFRR